MASAATKTASTLIRWTNAMDRVEIEAIVPERNGMASGNKGVKIPRRTNSKNA
jgi:hypothetical protein